MEGLSLARGSQELGLQGEGPYSTGASKKEDLAS